MRYITITARNPFSKNKFEQIKPYVKDGYYMTFTKIPKVGINPNNTFGTPTGIYTYPIKLLYDDFVNHRLPYAQDSDYIQVLKLNTKKVLTNTAKAADFNRDIKKLEKLYKKYVKVPISDKNRARLMLDLLYYPKEERNHILNTIFSFRHYLYWINVKAKKLDNSWFAKIWAATYILAMLIKPNYMHLWNKILQYLGYEVVIDNGSGVIHPHEPTQAVFLSVKAYKHVDSIKNKHNKNYIKIDDKVYSLNALPTKLDRLNLSHNKEIKRLPENLTANFLDLNDTNLRYLPNGLKVKKLNIGNTSISELPDDIQVETLSAEGSNLQWIPKSVYIKFLDISLIPYRVKIDSERMGKLLAESSNFIIPNCKFESYLNGRHSKYVKLGNITAEFIDLQYVQHLEITGIIKCEKIVLPNDFKYDKSMIQCPNITGGIPEGKPLSLEDAVKRFDK